MSNEPTKYACNTCGASGVRLWREYQVAYSELYCVTCALASSHAGSATVDSLRDSDAIGWLVPVVPSDDGWWGYHSVTVDGAAWWYSLPCAKLVRRDYDQIWRHWEEHADSSSGSATAVAWSGPGNTAGDA